MGAPKRDLKEKVRVRLNLVGVDISSPEETKQQAEKPALSELQQVMEELRVDENVKSLFEEGDPWATAQEEVLPTVEKPPPLQIVEPKQKMSEWATKVTHQHRMLYRTIKRHVWLRTFVPKLIQELLSASCKPISSYENGFQEWYKQAGLRHSTICNHIENMSRIQKFFLGKFYDVLCKHLNLERKKEIDQGAIHCS